MHRVKCCKLAAVAETDDGMDIFYDFAYSTKKLWKCTFKRFTAQI